MNFSKSEQINVLQMIKSQKVIPDDEKHDLIIKSLIEEGWAYISDDMEYIVLSYFGFRTLEDWDPFLGVSVNYQLVQTPYGEA